MASVDSDEENFDPEDNDNSLDGNSVDTKVLEIHKEFFSKVGEVIGKNSCYYRCLYPGCRPKTNSRDGSEKLLVVRNDSRYNAQRHFMQHDKTNQLGHKEKWAAAIKKLNKNDTSVSKNINSGPRPNNIIVSQKQLDHYILNFLIVDVLPLNTVEKPGFINLISRLAPNLTIHGRTFFTNLLHNTFEERKATLKSVLANSTDAATTVDAWTARRRAYLEETVHWFHNKNLKRKSACLAIRRIVGRHTFDVLATLIEKIHEEFKICDKLRGSTTDNGSNFIKCFKEHGATSTIPSYDSEELSDDEEDSMVYLSLGDILADEEIHTLNPQVPKQTTLPVHRKCACHLLSLISKVDIIKIQDYFYQQLRKNTQEKLQLLWNKQTSSSINSDIIFRHLDKLLIVKNDTRWNSEFRAVDCIVRLFRKKSKALRKLFSEFGISYLTPQEEQYLKEYVRVMKPVADSLDILQGEENVGMGFLLPTIAVLKNSLKVLQDDATIIHCQPLIAGLLDAIHFRFDQAFNDNELRLAAMSNPMFKLSWLENDEEMRRAETLLRGELGRLQGFTKDHSSSDVSSDETSSSRSDPSPVKRRKSGENFFATITKKISRTTNDDEVSLYLKGCNNLQQLNDYPTIKRIYRRYNVTLPSSAAVERLFSQGGLIYVPKRLRLTDAHFEMLLFFKVNHQVLTSGDFHG